MDVFCVVVKLSRRALTTARVALACGVLAASLSDRAAASAWNRLAGDGLAIVDVTFGEGNDYFDRRGHRAPARSYSKAELAGYVEYGATDWLMLVARPSLDRIRIGAPDAGRFAGLGGTAAGAQLHLLDLGPAVFAVQATFSLPGSTSRRDPAQIGNTAREADLRGLGGIGFPIGPFPAFLDIQQSYRIRSSGAAAQWHSDLTFGVSPTTRLLILLQNTSAVPLGPGTAWFPDARSSKLGLTAVYDLTRAWALKCGLFTTVWGRGALRERGVQTGIWHRF